MKVNLTKDEFVQKFKENKANLNDPVVLDYKEKILLINEEGTPRNLFLYLPESKRIQQAKLNFSSLFSALHKLVKHVVYEAPELLNFLDKKSIDLEALRKRSVETLLGYARIDTIFSEEEFKVLEFNSRRPQMYEDADWFSEYVSRIIGFENIEGEENGFEILEAIQAHFELNTKKKIPETIVVLNNFPNHRYPYSSLTKLNNYFDESNIFVFNCSNVNNFYKNIELTNTGIHYEGAKIDLIILQSVCGSRSVFNRSGGIRDARIAQAYGEGKVELFTQPSGQISGTKLALDLLQSKEIQAKLNLTSDELEAIKTVPESVHSHNLEELEHYNKEDYVIKLTGQGQGSGVKLGSEMTKDQWNTTLKELIKDEVKFLLQERINFSEEKIFNVQSKKLENAFLTLEPFVINNPLKSTHPLVSGYSTRAIPIDQYEKNLKFNPAYNKKQIYFGAVVETNEQ